MDVDSETPNTPIWGYLEPLVPSDQVERLTFHEPCLQQGVTLGRVADNDYVLPGAGVSSRHATIQWNGNRNVMSVVTLTDSSLNGTYVDGVKVNGTHQLFNGSTVFFGSKVPVIEEAADFRYIFHHPYGRSKSETVFNHYIMGVQLGGGAFGVVHKATERKSGNLYAVKTAWKNDRQRNTITCAGQETMAMMILSHPNICKLHEVFFRIDGQLVDIVLEFVDGISLLQLHTSTTNNQLTEDQAREISFQVCTALAYVHDQGVSHGDLKPDNILITRAVFPVVKLVDFGLARVINNYNAKPMATIHMYAAPEACSQVDEYGEGLEVGMSKLWDNWALGCVIFKLLAYDYPFGTQPAYQIDPALFHWNALNGNSAEAIDLVKKLLVRDTRHRMTARATLDQPWLSGYRPYQVSFASVSFEKPPEPAEFEPQAQPMDDEDTEELDDEAEGRKGKGRRRPAQRPYVASKPSPRRLRERRIPVNAARGEGPSCRKRPAMRLHGRPKRL
ncbi:kinase-like domain-containing protein [Mycena maculata]|uniref:non-specific serine/threonine protein kinase n=1 Tax=Mycena maculata TaxID=230809 RepID=A0AAD7KDF3_9AGAR|nr:kinase-like domain-containing protein [Mycena maculata]